MSLQSQIDDAIKSAMRARDAERLGTLRMVKSAIGYALIDAKADQFSDPEIVALLQKEVKKRRDAAEQYDKGARPELAGQERREITVIESFLPKPFSAEELETLVKATIEELGATGKKEMGRVIKAVQAKSAGRADGKTISGLVGKLLP
jgi:uncharacterized protein